MPDIDDFARVGMEVTAEAGRLLLERFHTEFTISHKGTVNLVTEVDLAAEELIVSTIRKAFPDHSILAEERHSQNRGKGIVWVIDPLDGTTNYAHGYPVFSVSIGLEIEGEVEWGAVFDPTRNELFSARRGFGATCNGIPLSVSKTSVSRRKPAGDWISLRHSNRQPEQPGQLLRICSADPGDPARRIGCHRSLLCCRRAI